MWREEGDFDATSFRQDPCTSECRKLGDEVFRTWWGRGKKGKRENAPESRTLYHSFLQLKKGRIKPSLSESAFQAIPVFPDCPRFTWGSHRSLKSIRFLHSGPLSSGGKDGERHRDRVPGAVSSIVFTRAEYFQTYRKVERIRVLCTTT